MTQPEPPKEDGGRAISAINIWMNRLEQVVDAVCEIYRMAHRRAHLWAVLAMVAFCLLVWLTWLALTLNKSLWALSSGVLKGALQ